MVVPISSDDVSLGLAGIVYGVAIIGSEKSAVMLGVAGVYGTDFEDFQVGEEAAFLVGFERQLSSSVKFITEDYLVVGGEAGGLLSAGVRFFGDRLAADLAAVSVFGGGEFFVSPILYVGFAYNFGR